MTTDSKQAEVLVEVKNVVKHFGSIKAVDDISFTVKRGDILGFLGPNGAGKSTAMKIITCFLEQDSGTVEVSGNDTLDNPLAVRQGLGYLPESAPAYGEMTVYGFLDFICDARAIDEKVNAIARVVNMTGLEKVLHQTVETLSKGFKRRVGLAQALIHDPQVLILDEPTDGLDPNQKKLVQDLILNIARDKAIIFSTHILDEVERVCNRALIISEGKILTDSTPHELMKQAPSHNVIEVVLDEPNRELINRIRDLDWVEKVLQDSDSRFEVFPKDQASHISDLMPELADVAVSSVTVHEGRLEDLFRNITGGVEV